MHEWGSSLDLLNPSLIDGGNYKTLSAVFTHLLALFTLRREQYSTYLSTLIDKSWVGKQGVEPSYSTIRIPQTFPFRAVARPLEVHCVSGQGWGIEPLTPPKRCVIRYHHLPWYISTLYIYYIIFGWVCQAFFNTFFIFFVRFHLWVL